MEEEKKTDEERAVSVKASTKKKECKFGFVFILVIYLRWYVLHSN